MSKPNPKVDWYFNKAKKWRAEQKKLRNIMLACGLTEELKWGHPCYTSEKKNIVVIHAFNDYCALLFFKGALLKDSGGVLIRQTENVQSARQIRFTTVAEIVATATLIEAYVHEAVEVERSGLKISRKQTSDFMIPDEFQMKLDQDPALESAFGRLTPGRQRGYLFHFSGAKLSKTRRSRVEKCIPRILEGKGLDDD